MLRALEIPYIALTPGASFRGLHDSLVNHLGNTRPELLLCIHEETAVALAHGYARVTGRPLAVALHANVGLMHATMAIFNAWCDRIPMLMLGGVGPHGCDEAAPVGRLDPYVARSRRARARLHQMGRSAGIGARGTRSDAARLPNRDDVAAGPGLRVRSMPRCRRKRSPAPVPLPAARAFPRRGGGRAAPRKRCARSRTLLEGATRPLIMIGRVSSDPADFAAARGAGRAHRRRRADRHQDRRDVSDAASAASVSAEPVRDGRCGAA